MNKEDIEQRLKTIEEYIQAIRNELNNEDSFGSYIKQQAKCIESFAFQLAESVNE